MAVAMESGGVAQWNASPSTSGFVGLLSSRKKRGWGEDQNKLLQLMIGQPIDDDSSSAADSGRTTLDLLGAHGYGCSSSSCSSSSELNHHHEPLDLKLDMEMPPPSGWEKRLDLKAGRFFYVNLSTGKSTQQHPNNRVPEDLESIPSSSWDLQSELDRIGKNNSSDTETLDLKLNLGGCRSDAPPPKPKNNISTIEAVQEALKRSAARSSPSSSTTSSSSSSSRVLRCHDQHNNQAPNFSTDRNAHLRGMMIKTTKRNEIVVDSKLHKLSSSPSPGGTQVLLTGCKRCLMYVMLTSSDPRCPKCGSSVAADIQQDQYHISKKPRLELNLL